MNGNAEWLVLDIMFMVPEIDACLTLAFRNRPDVAMKLAAFHLLLSQRQSALTVEDRPIPSVSAPVSRNNNRAAWCHNTDTVTVIFFNLRSQ